MSVISPTETYRALSRKYTVYSLCTGRYIRSKCSFPNMEPTLLSNCADMEHLTPGLDVRIVTTDDFALAGEVRLRQIVEIEILQTVNVN